ncbi:hypothetical protein SEUCBS140593_010372 [Sporothrix eucalyptigena]|uniref:Bud22 domain-containing protein n=1 Tax=Sporothrix eucalyptigena TaxID=1812306 RepID=A0ABP0D4D7_9PEZI
MLKRKRPDGRAPNKGANGSSNNYSAAPPPSSVKPQPEKAVTAFESSYADVLRALKKARGFERQRLARRIQEEKKQTKGKKGKGKKAAKTADPNGEAGASEERIQRLEREVEVLKTLDYEVTARVHLANAMMRTRDLPDAPGPLGAHLQLASEVLSQRTKAYRTDDIHNVTSALYNRPFVRDAVAKAVRGMCQLVGVPPPDKNAGRQRKGKDDKDSSKEKEDAVDKETQKNTKVNTGKPIDPLSDDDDDEEEEEEEDNTVYNEEDDEAIERELAKYDSMLGGSGGEESGSEGGDDDDDSDDDSDEGLDDDAVVAKLRAKYKAAVAKGLWRDDGDEISDEEGGSDDGEDDDEEEDEFAGFSPGESDEEAEEEEEEEEDESDSSSDEDLRPQKRAATSSTSGGNHFLPTLMGGYISDGDDGDDDDRRAKIADDEAAAERMLGGPRKNRRGQRARQAIWEKKYKLLAKHVLEGEKKEKTDGKKDKSGKAGKQRESGWDAKRGAVDANDAPRWMRRKMGLTGRVGPAGGGASGKGTLAAAKAPGRKENTNANAQVSGTLHPSWEAARMAKDKAQTAAFEGKKIVFD